MQDRKTGRNIFVVAVMLAGLFTFRLWADGKEARRSQHVSEITAAQKAPRQENSTRPGGARLVARYGKAILLITDSNDCPVGTASVISKTNRLAVTNSHVAETRLKDRNLRAYVNGTDEYFEVERVWYHPAVKRYLRNEPRMIVRSMAPRDGSTYARSPDIAVLQLARRSNKWSSLSVEIPLATPAELKNLQSQPISLIGFPCSDTMRVPIPGTVAAATYKRGEIDRVTGFERRLRWREHSKNQFVQHSVLSWPGFSGSPIILDTGHLAAVHNSSIPARAGSREKWQAHGIRIDTLSELLAFHKLQGKVKLPAKADVAFARETAKEIRRAQTYRRAIRLVDEAKQLVEKQGKVRESLKKCADAVKLLGFKEFSYAHQIQALARLREVMMTRPALSKEEGRRRLRKALSDCANARRYAHADYKYESDIVRAMVLNEYASFTDSKYYHKRALDLTYAIGRSWGSLTREQQARMYCARAVALSKGKLKDPLKKKSALWYFNKSIEWSPHDRSLYLARADYWNSIGNQQHKQTDLIKAQNLLRKSTINKRAGSVSPKY